MKKAVPSWERLFSFPTNNVFSEKTDYLPLKLSKNQANRCISD
jgi:hypothetical protein